MGDCQVKRVTLGGVTPSAVKFSIKLDAPRFVHADGIPLRLARRAGRVSTDRSGRFCLDHCSSDGRERPIVEEARVAAWSGERSLDSLRHARPHGPALISASSYVGVFRRLVRTAFSAPSGSRFRVTSRRRPRVHFAPHRNVAGRWSAWIAGM
jgi:hypothetical protein